MAFQKCLLFFGKRKQKQKFVTCVKKLLVIAVAVFKKAKCTCLIGENCSQEVIQIFSKKKVTDIFKASMLWMLMRKSLKKKIVNEFIFRKNWN